MSNIYKFCPIQNRECDPSTCTFYDLDKHYCLLVNAVNPASTTSLTALLKRIGSTLDRMEYEG
jgi:hypothetical protein